MMAQHLTEGLYVETYLSFSLCLSVMPNKNSKNAYQTLFSSISASEHLSAIFSNTTWKKKSTQEKFMTFTVMFLRRREVGGTCSYFCDDMKAEV